ncbi:carbohydrate ABC transporter permease [Mobilitalea sibirica]|uniref:Carbohydrate ABC transporter permease n=1 Tax=Mobilitalea sibirica TaxID=1462919 RepID=A0A8J7H3S0_9FIRM|nr:carbohydrate ABC transporter permease [Mobilitalea sibirica]MBH1941863.1 carbohydrate ABC transporter permease [Mobilitalea sibirica]
MRYIRIIVLGLLCIIVLFPIIFTITNSFSDHTSILDMYGAVLMSGGEEAIAKYGEFVSLNMFPGESSLEQFKTVLWYRTDAIYAFWNSVRYTVVIVFFQVIVSAMAAYAYAKLNFRFKNILYFISIVIMVMPQQVTLVPNFYVLNKLGWLDSALAVTVPAIFSTFGVFLLTQFMKDIPASISEAARIDGAGEWKIFLKIILPPAKGAVSALVLLSFVENWNMVEAPLVFLKNKGLFPLSIILNSSSLTSLGTAFAIGTVFMLFPLILFLLFEEDLVESIGFTNLTM